MKKVIRFARRHYLATYTVSTVINGATTAVVLNPYAVWARVLAGVVLTCSLPFTVAAMVEMKPESWTATRKALDVASNICIQMGLFVSISLKNSVASAICAAIILLSLVPGIIAVYWDRIFKR